MSTKIYVSKSQLNQTQTIPIPTDLENWIDLDFDPNFDYKRKTYDIALGQFVDTSLTTDKILALRKAAYISESDPLFMEWQFDKTPESEQVWRDKVAEIKLRYPLSVSA